MKTCTYCGRENELTNSLCSGCGTELTATDRSAPSLQPSKTEKATGDSPPVRISAIAVVSLIAGIVGLVLILNMYGEVAASALPKAARGIGHSRALVSLAAGICSVIALARINRSGGRLKGRLFAVAGVCLFGLASTLWLLLMPTVAKRQARAQRLMCSVHLEQLAKGLRQYANDHQGQLPRTDQWCEAVTPYVQHPTVFRCPAAHDSSRCTYALNLKLSGLRMAEVHPNTVLLFEIKDGWNASAGLEQALAHNPHGGSCLVALADGKTQPVLLSRLSELRWDP